MRRPVLIPHIDDIAGDCMIEAINAIRSFDPSRAKLTTHVGNTVDFKIRRIIEPYLVPSGAHVPGGLIADKTGKTHAEQARLMTREPVRIDADRDTGDARMAWLLADTRAESIPDNVDRLEAIGRVRRALIDLPERWAEIVRSRFGIDRAPQTLDEIGARLGISRERVRQLEGVAVEKLRAALEP